MLHHQYILDTIKTFWTSWKDKKVDFRDPREWWDKSWYYAHIVQKIESVKRELGIGDVTNSL